jgi:hypothetical protein
MKNKDDEEEINFSYRIIKINELKEVLNNNKNIKKLNLSGIKELDNSATNFLENNTIITELNCSSKYLFLIIF